MLKGIQLNLLDFFNFQMENYSILKIYWKLIKISFSLRLFKMQINFILYREIMLIVLKIKEFMMRVFLLNY